MCQSLGIPTKIEISSIARIFLFHFPMIFFKYLYLIILNKSYSYTAKWARINQLTIFFCLDIDFIRLVKSADLGSPRLAPGLAEARSKSALLTNRIKSISKQKQRLIAIYYTAAGRCGMISSYYIIPLRVDAG